MKIILATGIFPPDIGGPATYSERLAEELIKKKIKAEVICYSDVKSYKDYDFSVKRISRQYSLVFRYFLYFLELLQTAKDTDVIYAQNQTSVGVPSWLVCKILGKRLVLKIVGDGAWENYVNRRKEFDNIDIFQRKKYDFLTEFVRKLQRTVVKGADKIIVPSVYLKKIIIGWGVSEHKIEVVYNAIDYLPELKISKDEAKSKIGVEGDIISSIGRLSPWKGFSALIESMPSLLKENPNFKLVIIGEGEEEDNLKLKVKNLNLENNVKLVGKISHESISFYFKASDIFVLNSEYEGLSHTILEAMYFGLPVITSDKGGNPELVEDGFNGFLVEYNNKEQIKDKILRLWKDKILQETFIKNSKEKLKNFSWQNLVEKTLKVLIT